MSITLINPSIREVLLDAVAASPGSSSTFALPANANQVSWQTSFGTLPDAVSISIEVSLDNVNWAAVSTSTAVAGEVLTFLTSAVFARATINSITNGDDVTVSLVTKLSSFSSVLNSQIILPTAVQGAGSPGNYTHLNSGLVFYDAAGTEILRLWASDPDVADWNEDNLYIGRLAGENQPTDNVSAGYQNIGIGSRALQSITTGNKNVGIGYYSEQALTEGLENTAFGHGSLQAVTTGDDNTGIGISGGYHITTGNKNTAIGAYASPTTGALTNTIAIGYNANPSASNRAVIGDVNLTDVYLGSEVPNARLLAKFLTLTGIPAADPGVPGQVYHTTGTLKISL